MAEQKQTPLAVKKKRLTRGRKIKLVILGIVIFAGWWAWHTVSAPVTGTQVVAEKGLQTKKVAAKSPAGQTAVSGEYFNLNLPAGFRAQANSQSTPGLLQQKTLIKPGDFGSTVVNIGVKNLPEGGLQGDSSYALRVNKPNQYSLTSINAQGQTVPVAVDSQSAATVGFWVHGPYLATISVSSGLGNPSPETTQEQLKVLQTVISGWQWQ